MKQQLARVAERFSTTTPVKNTASFILAWAPWLFLGWRIISDLDVALSILKGISNSEQSIKLCLGDGALVQPLLHGLELLLHLVELRHLGVDGVILDLGFLLLLQELALGPSPLAAHLEHVDGGAVALYANEKEDEDEDKRKLKTNGDLQETCVEA